MNSYALSNLFNMLYDQIKKKKVKKEIDYFFLVSGPNFLIIMASA